MDATHLDIELLPASVRDLAGIVGLAAALRLIERYAGQIAVYVPQVVRPDHPLAQAIGEEAAMRLAAAYGGDYLRNIPTCAATARRARERAIRRMRAQGDSPAEIARKLGITERWVWEVLRRIRHAGPGQMTLPGVSSS